MPLIKTEEQLKLKQYIRILAAQMLGQLCPSQYRSMDVEVETERKETDIGHASERRTAEGPAPVVRRPRQGILMFWLNDISLPYLQMRILKITDLGICP